jgi:uncharacterized membrane protein
MMKSRQLQAATALLLACSLLAAGNVAARGNTGNKDNTFTAAGHDPEWQLTIDNSSRAVELIKGVHSLKFRYPKTGPSFHRDTRTTVYQVPNDEYALSIRVKEQACRDSITGKSHETTVLVVLDGEGYYGCGDYAH